jgi:hypothetical protein
LTVLASIPNGCGPAKTSPVTFRMSRLYFGNPVFIRGPEAFILFELLHRGGSVQIV